MMRKLYFISIMIMTITLTANEHYLLPEHKSDLIHTLKRKIERAGVVTIITSKLESPGLKKSIEKSLANSGNLHLITTDITSAAVFSKYKNSTVKVPKSKRLIDSFHLNVILIDKSDVCFSALAFDERIWSREIGEVICTTNSEEVDFARHLKQRFSDRFEDYSR